MSLPERHSPYITSIDGLRTVAVGLVLLFHAGFDWAQGGYIGVDVFFVISGFLITSNILKGLEAGTWSFRRFYGRRAARLLPALFSVIAGTLIAGSFILSESDFAKLGLSGLASAASVSNILFWTQADYFAQGSETKPLLHTWSLGVEEQFYLFWPIAITVFFQLARKLGLNTPRSLIQIGLLLLGGVSLMSAHLMVFQHPEAVFFLTPFRVFQFAIGGLLGVSVTLTANFWRCLPGLAGLGLLLCLGTLLQGQMGADETVWLAMFAPALATATIIFAARTRLITAMLATPAMVWLGKRSYAIYLAHWPIMVLWKMATDYHFDTLEACLSIAVSVMAGAIIHTIVEKRFRLSNSSTVSKKRTSYMSTGLGFVCVAILTLSISWPLIGNTLQATASKTPPQASSGTAVSEERRSTCFLQAQHVPEDYSIEQCATSQDGKPVFLALGDSYAGDMSVALQTAYAQEAKIGRFVVPGCSLISPGQASKKSNHCQSHFNLAYTSIIDEIDLRGVFLISDWTKVDDETLTETLDYFETREIPTYIVNVRPKFRERVPEIISLAETPEAAAKRVMSLLIPEAAARNQALADKYPNIIDVYRIGCNETCQIFDGNSDEIYKDASHITIRGSVWYGRRIKEAYPDVIKDMLSH